MFVDQLELLQVLPDSVLPILGILCWRLSREYCKRSSFSGYQGIGRLQAGSCESKVFLGSGGRLVPTGLSFGFWVSKVDLIQSKK
jgi:hypothetical protein